MKGLIFTYLLTYGGAFVSLLNPFVGLLIYVCFAIIRPESLWHWSVPAGNYSRIVAVGLLVGWVLNGCGNWRLGKAWALAACLAAYWLWAAISATQATDAEVAWSWVEMQGKIVLPVLVGFTLVESIPQLKQLAWVIVLSHGFVAYELNLSYYSGFNVIQQVGFAGMDNNSFSIAMCTSAGLAFFLGLNATAWWQKLLAFASAGLMVHTVFFAFSRGGMLGLVIIAVISFVLIPKKLKHYFTLVAALLVAIRLAGPEVVQRFSSVFVSQESRDESAQSRLDMWKICLQIMSQYPILGLGPHQFPVHAHEYGLNRGKEAHSLWLQIGAELGVPGLVFLGSFYAICAARLWPFARGRRPSANEWYTDTARMVVSGLTGFAVSAQFVSLPGLESPYYIVLLGGGVLKLWSTAPSPTAVMKPAFAAGSVSFRGPMVRQRVTS